MPQGLGVVEDFEEFVTAALPELLRFGVVLTGDRHRADDLVQTALVKTMRRWSAIDRGQPMAYVRRVMVTTQLTWWRRARRETGMPEGLDVVDPRSTDAYDDQHVLAAALRALPPRQRAVIVLRYYAGYSEAEIAETLGCSPGTVKSQASKAMHTMRRILRTDTDDRLPAEAQT